MAKKIGLLIAVLSLMTMTISPVQAQSESAISLEVSVITSFPNYIDFNLSIESDTDIKDIRLHYVVQRESFSDVTHEVDVGIPLPYRTTMDVYWRWDMRTTGTLPSGTVIRYWWTITDVSGKTYETVSDSVSFDDTNYDWQSITEGNITLHWYSGGMDFAGVLMQTCQEALVRLGEDTGAYLEDPITVYIYSSSSDLQNAMIFAQEWTGGVAYPEYGVIAIGISRSNIEWGKRAMVHEMAHLVTHQMTSNPYNSIPVWLDEGMSMYAEGELEESYESYLKNAVRSDILISVQSLCSPFSAYSDKSYLSYAESYNLVAFLIENYGQEKMFELLTTFKNGSTYDNALLTVYGFDINGLNYIWQDYVAVEYKSNNNIYSYNPKYHAGGMKIANL
jgi:hypothetical protein